MTKAVFDGGKFTLTGALGKQQAFTNTNIAATSFTTIVVGGGLLVTLYAVCVCLNRVRTVALHLLVRHGQSIRTLRPRRHLLRIHRIGRRRRGNSTTTQEFVGGCTARSWNRRWTATPWKNCRCRFNQRHGGRHGKRGGGVGWVRVMDLLWFVQVPVRT